MIAESTVTYQINAVFVLGLIFLGIGVFLFVTTLAVVYYVKRDYSNGHADGYRKAKEEQLKVDQERLTFAAQTQSLIKQPPWNPEGITPGED